MSLRINYQPEHGQIKLSGKFVMETHRDFSRACRNALPNFPKKDLILDMEDVVDIDSSALGMLLTLRQNAQKQGTEIVLKDCRPNVFKVLSIARFDKLFAIKKTQQ